MTDLAWMARMNGQRYPNAVEWEFAQGVAGLGFADHVDDQAGMTLRLLLRLVTGVRHRRP